jgi:hypothetical protein
MAWSDSHTHGYHYSFGSRLLVYDADTKKYNNVKIYRNKAYALSDTDLAWPGDPAIGQFNVTVTWEKGGTLIFHAQKTTYTQGYGGKMRKTTVPAKPTKVHLYAPKE